MTTAFLLVAGLLAGPAAPPAPGVDWTTGIVRVMGVGTPRILSPTGGLLERDAIELAREDAFLRLRKAFMSLPRPAEPPGGPTPLAAAADRAVTLAVFSEPLFFADGTAHMTADVALFAALGSRPVPTDARVLRVEAPAGFTPCVQVRLEAPGSAAVYAGLPGDAVPHLRWRARTPNAQGRLTATSAGACTLSLPSGVEGAPIVEVELP
jgi:hypothetical protein